MLARTLAVVGVVGGAVWAVSKYLKAQNGSSALVGAGDGDNALSSPPPQNGDAAGRSASAPVSNSARTQPGSNH